jgi:outer membrane protein assembly factor BamB
MKIDPKQQGHLPRVDEPSPFVSPDGRFRGWRVTIPGRRSLATPAVVDGRVFVGGGFGGYDFYAFDARDGRLAWQYQTSTTGPPRRLSPRGTSTSTPRAASSRS